MSGKIKKVFAGSFAGKLAYLLTRPAIKEFRASMDYTEYGGAPILGVCAPVIKAHGSSNAKAIKNAIRQAKACVENDVVGAIRSASKTAEEEA
jgi:glycerol-3-phosphate acyltransferase PlsX